MKKKKYFFTLELLVVFLLITLCVFSVFLALENIKYLFLALFAAVAALVLIIIFTGRIRKGMKKFFFSSKKKEELQQSTLVGLAMPVLLLSEKNVVWYNNAFLETFLYNKEAGFAEYAKILPDLNLQKVKEIKGQDICFDEKRFTAFGSELKTDSNMFFVCFVEDTALKIQAEEYAVSRPAVMLFLIDTYDEILKEMKESERALLMSGIDNALEKYIGASSGFIRRISSSSFLAVVEERHVAQMVERRFDILDQIREIDGDAMTVTLSIGVGRLGESFAQCEEMAVQALDMALGRGGDQAAVKTAEGFEFYGGVSRSVEKRTKVKSRIIATAIKDLLPQYERVLIMGHKNSDMDSVGAAVGMLRFCRIFNKQAAIVVDKKTSAAQNLLTMLENDGYSDAFLTPYQALPLASNKTLLIIVDTHVKFLLESAEIFDECGGVVLIDHHRRMVGHIDNAVIFYHEPYASSASELVSELLLYAGDGKNNKPTPAEAEALLAGIMLDTRTFSLHVGVRTFEAAAFLRRAGAQTEIVKKMFSSSMDEYLYRCHLVSEAVVEHNCAVVVSDKIPHENEVVAPQAANDLLTIEGVKASFVAIKQGEEIRISARSMGEVNVQLVMEKLRGGGHLTMAGAQLKNVDINQAHEMIKKAIEEYFDERIEQREKEKNSNNT